MPARSPSTLDPGLAKPRDPVEKLLGLLDFSAGASEVSRLGDTLSVLLLSLMGEFAAKGGVVLLAESPGRLRVVAARGSGSARSKGRSFEIEASQALREPAMLADLAEDNPLRAAFAPELEVELLVPIRHAGAFLGVLGLGARGAGRGWQGEEHRLVARVANIAGTIVSNARLYAELQQANRKLRRHLFDLHALFHVGRELGGSVDPESIYRILVHTAMAHALVTRAVVLMVEGERLVPVFSRGVSLDGPVLEGLDGLEARDAEPALSELASTLGLGPWIPLASGSVTRGFLGLGERPKERPLAQEDLEFLTTLGVQAVTALDSLRFHNNRTQRERLERELAIARSIQAGLFPRALPELDGYTLAATSEPCFEVGGDYYDAFPTPSGVLIALGDVSGKSVPAALLMSVLQATLRSLASRPGETPRQLLEALNCRLFESTQPGRFASFFLGLLDPATGSFRYANAGHNPPLAARADGGVRCLTEGGPVLGVFAEAHYEEAEIRLEPGTSLLLYTDGISEAMNPADEEYGEARLERLLVSQRARSADRILGAILEDVREHAQGLHPTDDITALVVARAPGSAD